MKEYALIKKKYLLLPVMIIDALGFLAVWFWTQFRPIKLPEKWTRILLVRLDHMGDVIMATPTIKALDEFLPGTRIDFAVASWSAIFPNR